MAKKKATKTIAKTTTKGKGQQRPHAVYRSSWAGKHWGVKFEWFLSSVKLSNGIVTELWKGWAWGPEKASARMLKAIKANKAMKAMKAKK
jgi:hypothetical protein